MWWWWWGGGGGGDGGGRGGRCFFPKLEKMYRLRLPGGYIFSSFRAGRCGARVVHFSKIGNTAAAVNYEFPAGTLFHVLGRGRGGAFLVHSLLGTRPPPFPGDRQNTAHQGRQNP